MQIGARGAHRTKTTLARNPKAANPGEDACRGRTAAAAAAAKAGMHTRDEHGYTCRLMAQIAVDGYAAWYFAPSADRLEASAHLKIADFGISRVPGDARSFATSDTAATSGELGPISTTGTTGRAGRHAQFSEATTDVARSGQAVTGSCRSHQRCCFIVIGAHRIRRALLSCSALDGGAESCSCSAQLRPDAALLRPKACGSGSTAPTGARGVEGGPYQGAKEIDQLGHWKEWVTPGSRLLSTPYVRPPPCS